MKKEGNNVFAAKCFVLFLLIAVFMTVFAMGAMAADVSTEQELISAISMAPTDGTEYIVNVKQNISVQSILITPKNSNIKIVGDGIKTIYGNFSERSYGLIDVNVGATLSLENITIDPNGTANIPVRAIYVSKNGTLNVGSGTVLTDAYYNANGGAVYVNGGVINLLGGNICNSTTTNNGGAIFAAANGETLSTVNLYSGDITNNTAGTVNGAIYVNGGTLNLYDRVVWGTQYNSSTGAEANTVGVSAQSTLNIYYAWDQTRQNTQSLSEWNLADLGGLTIESPLTKGAKNGEAAIVITGTVSISQPINIPAGFNIKLRGNGIGDKIVYTGSSNRAITVKAGGELVIENITVDVSSNPGQVRCIVVSDADLNHQQGKLTLNDGAILTGGKVSGGGIYNQGTVIMNGGTITGNTSPGGAAGINSNGANSSLTLLGGSITGNTAAAEGAGVYVFGGGSLCLGGEANVIGNTTLGQPSNICIASTSYSKVEIKSDFNGNVGIHTPFTVLGSAENLFDVANIESGFVLTNGNITADEPAFNVSIASGKLRVSASVSNITVKSPNGNRTISNVAPRGFFELPSPVVPLGFTAKDFVGYVKVSGYGTAQAQALAIYKEGDLVSAADFVDIYQTYAKVSTLESGRFRFTTGDGSAFYVVTEVDTGILSKVGMYSLSDENEEVGYLRKVLSYTGVSSSANGNTFVVTETLNPSVIRKAYGDQWDGNRYIYPEGKPASATKDAYLYSVGVSNTNYEKPITFRGFIEFKYSDGTVGRIYSDFTYSDHTRSLKQVAEEYVQKVLFVPGTEQITAVQKSKIFEVTDYTAETLVWSSRFGAYVDPINPTQENIQFYLTPLARGGRLDENNEAKHVVFFGDSLICGYNMADLVEAFSIQSGHKVDVDAVTSMTLGTSSSYALRLLFEMSGTNFLDADGNVTTDYTQLVIKSGSNPTKMKFLINNTDNPIDVFYIVYNRDLIKGTNANYNNEIIAAKALAYKVKQNHPNAEIVLVVPPAYLDNDFRITYSKWYKNSDAHFNATTSNVMTIKNEMQSVGISAEILNIGQYWRTFSAEGIDLYTMEANASDGTFAGLTLHRHPSVCGAYFTAALFCADITGECVKGLDVYGRLTQNDSIAIQQQVHNVIGCSETEHHHTPADLEIMKGSGDYIFPNEENAPDREKLNALIGTLLAYEARGNWVQYDQKVMNRNVPKGSPDYREFRHVADMESSLPEDSSPQFTMYTDCSDWVSAVFDVAFSNSQFTTRRSCQSIYQNRQTIPYLTDVYTWTDEDVTDGIANNNTAADRDGSYVLTLNNVVQASVKTRAGAKQALVNTLKPGDVILYIHKGSSSYANFASGGGHITIYIGGGLFMHCSGDQAGAGGSDYRVESQNDLYELPGGIQIDLIDNLLDEGATRNIFDEAAITVLRPDYDSLVISDNAQARLSGLWGIVAYKTTSAPEGITVSAGGNVTFSFTVSNYTEFYREIAIEETLPAGLTYVSGATYSGGKVKYNFTVEPYETITVSYVVKVSNTATGTVNADSAYINGVQLGATPVMVADSLTESQKNQIVSYVRSNSGSYSNAYSLVANAYGNIGINFKNTYSTASSVLNAVFDETASGDIMHYTINNTSTMVPGNLFGGQNLKRTLGSSISWIKDLNPENLAAGDIIVFVDRDEAIATNTSFATAKAYIYLGNGAIACYDENGAYREINESAAIDLLDSVLGEGLYCVIRPSIVF